MRIRAQIPSAMLPVLLPALIAPSGIALGQGASESGAGIEEVIVTAQKREENQQDVPISITTITSDMIGRMVINDVTDLQGKAPNINFTDGGVVPGAFIPTIRGVGDRAADQLIDQPVLVVVDGVAYSSMLGGFLDTFDLEAVEVLRGPQGTLQGRNATGGALNIRTRRPSMNERELRTELDYGDYETWTARAALDGPLVEGKAAAKLAFISTDSEGAGDNYLTGGHFGGRRYTMGRLGFLFTPNEDLDIYLTAARAEDDSQQPLARQINTREAYPRPQTGGQGISVICAVFSVCTPDAPLTNGSAYTKRNWTNQSMFAATIDWDAGPVTFTSVSGYRTVEDSTNLDLDYSPLDFIQVEDQIHDIDTISQELRVASSDGGGWDLDGRLRWVGGFYYFDNEWDLVSPVCLPALGITCDVPARRGQEMESYAAFAHVDYSVSDRLEVFLGVRHTEDEKRFHSEVPVVLKEKASWSELTSEVGLKYNFTPDAMLYASFKQGYRAGGINPSGSIYDPETVDATELGMKVSAFDNRLTLNGAIFHYDYTDMQRGVVFPVPDPPFYEQGSANAAAATVQGAELELTARPIPPFLLGLQVGYLDASFDNYIDNVVNPDGSLTPVDNSGLRIANTPEWTLGSSLDYTLNPGGPGVLNSVLMHLDYSYRTELNVHPNDIPLGDQAAYGLLNASIRLTSASERFALTLYGKNLTDKYYITLADPVAGLTNYAIQGMPRTYGVRVSASFEL